MAMQKIIFQHDSIEIHLSPFPQNIKKHSCFTVNIMMYVGYIMLHITHIYNTKNKKYQKY